MTSKLAEHLRALPDDGLGAFLRLRPDLVVPVPADVSTLAARAQSRVSVARALDGLDQFTLEVLDGLRLVRREDGTAALDQLLTLAAEAGVEAGLVRTAVDRLRARFLVYGQDAELHLVRAIDELTSPYPAGLGRPAGELDVDAADLAQDPAGLRRTLLSAPPEARAILDRLAGGPPVGTVAPATLRSADSPVRWLVDHHLLVSIAADAVELPREVGVVLRRDAGPLGTLHPAPPALATTVRAGADSAGAGQALEAVRHLDALLQLIAGSPAPVLRSFGLGVRDLRRLARDAGTSEPVTALLLEIAYAAGLLTHTEPAARTGDQVWLPAPAYDLWRTTSLARRWAAMARTWLAMTRAPALVGQCDEKDKSINALSYEATRVSAPAARRAALGVLAELPPGSTASADEVLDRLCWQSPRRMARSATGPQAMARAALTEAAALGVTGLDALTSFGRVLLAEAPPDPDADPLGIRGRDGDPADDLLGALTELLPEPVDHVLVQADLTVVVPGPPEPALASELALVADTESRGGATVFRVTPASVRRALDAGYTAADVHALFHRRSRTSLPQTLVYLIDDVARRHGGLRIGTVGAYLRSEDEALLTEVLADRRLAALSLRRLAPTVLVTPHGAGRLLDALRDAGHAPVAEDAAGVAVLSRPKSPRGPARAVPRGARPDDFDPPNLVGPRLAAVVEQIRLGDRVARATRRSPLSRAVLEPDGAPANRTQQHTQALAVLQQAMRDKARVWVGYVDAQGGSSAKLVRPVSMGAGYLRAEDDRAETLHTFALHRITSAILAD
ncbi:MAG TPA: helicase-associated domain-containing protein [Micromonosporaceae bacterium]